MTQNISFYHYYKGTHKVYFGHPVFGGSHLPGSGSTNSQCALVRNKVPRCSLFLVLVLSYHQLNNENILVSSQMP